jgi:pyrroline-5-carboxylate reductase
MKKFLMALLAMLTCLFLVACAPADQYKAMEKMEKAGYKVSISSEDATELFVGETGVATVSASKSEGGITNLKVYHLLH